MRNALRIFFFATIQLFLSSKAFPWGAVTGFNTHGVIDQSAYELLSRDPAFDRKTFPSLDKILSYEGVYYVSGDDGLISGPGPDSSGASQFSDHYYNPQTKKGNAPEAVARHFRNFAPALLNSESSKTLQDFAWGAHFLADMSVVFHVVGMPYDEFWREYVKQKPTGKLTLPTEVTGDLSLLSYGMAPTHANDFLTEGNNIKASADGTVDWFDPWYWNGFLNSSKRSSHVAWEMWVRDAIETTNLGYSDHWENPVPDFDRSLEHQINSVKKMTSGAAIKTFINDSDFSKNSMPPLQEAVKNVATLWRASFSALNVNYSTRILNSDPTGRWVEVSAQIKNLASESAQGVQLRFTPVNIRPDKNCILTAGDAIQIQGELKAKESIDGKQKWTIFMPVQAYCAGKLEIIGHFQKTPDLQYNIMNKQIMIETQIRQIGLSTNINFKYNVNGSKLYNGIHDDGFFQTEKYSMATFGTSEGPFYSFEGPHNSQQAQFLIKTSEDRLLLETVSLKSELKEPKRETKNIYVIRNVPARSIKPFQSVPGLVFTLFYLKSDEFLKHIETKSTASWSDAEEWDEAAKAMVPVHYTTQLTELLPTGSIGDSDFFVLATSMPMEQIEKHYRDGTINRELFEKEYSELQNEISRIRESGMTLPLRF